MEKQTALDQAAAKGKRAKVCCTQLLCAAAVATTAVAAAAATTAAAFSFISVWGAVANVSLFSLSPPVPFFRTRPYLTPIRAHRRRRHPFCVAVCVLKVNI